MLCFSHIIQTCWWVGGNICRNRMIWFLLQHSVCFEHIESKCTTFAASRRIKLMWTIISVWFNSIFTFPALSSVGTRQWQREYQWTVCKSNFNAMADNNYVGIFNCRDDPATIGVRDGGSCPPPNSGSLSTLMRAESRHYSGKPQYMFE